MNKNIKYIVKPEEEMVIGIYEDNGEDLKKCIYSLSSNIQKAILGIVLVPRYPKQIKAIAKCHDGDEFDEEIGKKIVEAKINMKRHERMWRIHSHILESLQKAMNKLKNDQSVHLDKLYKIQDDYEKHYCGRVE
jgi:tRNA isopentenyl-2-thiomethyl-A-37 hydroxylase MiaE